MTTHASEPLGSWRQHFPHWDLQGRVAPPLADVLATGPRDEAELAFAKAVEALPKVELHVHMEAAVPAAFYACLNHRRRLYAEDDLPAQRAPFPTLKQFIDAWLDNCHLVDAEALFRDMARAFVELRAASNIRYSEAHISPFDFTYGRTRFGFGGRALDFRLALEGYLAGLKEGLAAHPGLDARLIVDMLWISEPAECDAMLKTLDAVQRISLARKDGSGEPLIVAIGLGGPEHVELAASKLSFVRRCRDLGLKVDIHSGETTTAAEHRHAVTTLAPDRVGHGIAPAVRPDPAAAVRFYERGVAACPTSNLLTGSFQGPLRAHPITAMLAQGTPVCVNTDDPLLFGTTLTLEFTALRQALGWDLATVVALQESAARMAFAPEAAQEARSR
jgi:adenosine deaminase